MVDVQKLKQLRKLANLTQAQLAKKADVSVQTIYRLETGRSGETRRITQLLISSALNVPYWEIWK